MRTSNPSQLQGSTASLTTLQATAQQDPKAAIKEAAKQFEALFMQEVLKSMRATTSGGPLENAGSQLGTEMLDQQYAVQMSSKPGSLSELIAKQLERQMGGNTTSTVDKAKSSFSLGQGQAVSMPIKGMGLTSPATSKSGSSSAERFVYNHTQSAKAAEAATGIPANFILGQGALESGWGRREIMNRDGTTSFNLFGIKAGPSWKGKVAEVTTTEYYNGKAHKVTAKFRAYDSYEDSFKDYAKLLMNSPRYAKVIAQSDTAHEFATGLQRAGYATDPAYADKLKRVIDMTHRLQRNMV